ncbi:MAG TPA: hypothetical protein VGE07_00485 [Herpetosiphonaceae bacterium]
MSEAPQTAETVAPAAPVSIQFVANLVDATAGRSDGTRHAMALSFVNPADKDLSPRIVNVMAPLMEVAAKAARCTITVTYEPAAETV